MDFRYTQDQQDLIDAAKAVFDGENTLERMRAMAAGEMGADLWPKFAELGLIGIMAAEENGGLNQPLVVMVGVAEAAGYSGLPEPLIEIAGVVVLNQDMGGMSELISGQSKFGIGSNLLPYMDAKLASGADVKSIDPLRKLVKMRRRQ